MAGVDLIGGGFDPWPEINAGPDLAGGDSAAGLLLGGFSGDWLSTGLQLLGGVGSMFGADMESNTGGASAAGQAGLNSSGWAVGKGASAQGADMATSASLSGAHSWPWWVWAVGTLAAVAVVKKVA